MKKIIITIAVCIMLIIINYSMFSSYSRYTARIESEDIQLNFRPYQDLTISEVEEVENEDNTYILTVSNPNNYNVTYLINSAVADYEDQTLKVEYIESDLENKWTVQANSTKESKVKISKYDNITYSTIDDKNEYIKVSINVKTIEPYEVSSATNRAIAYLPVEENESE